MNRDDVVEAIRKELVLSELANIEGASAEWLQGFRFAVSRFEATVSADPANISALAKLAPERDEKWPRGTRVTKTRGSSWTGRIVGEYSTSLTPEGYAVESENEPGSVQIYPRAALTKDSSHD